MGAKKDQGKPKRRVLKFVALLAALLVLYMAVRGSVVRVSCVDLPLRDLPPAFDGTKIVFVSDIHLTMLNPLAKTAAMMRQLEKIQPDLLLLGGDYTGTDLVGRLLCHGSNEAYAARQAETRALFFIALADFPAKLGKFAVAGDMDKLVGSGSGMSLEDAASLGGVTLLSDQTALIQKGGQTLSIVGVDDWRTGMQDTHTPARGQRSRDCVIVLSHTPEALPQLADQPGADGGQWIDASLTGHTLGGQIKIGKRELFNPLAQEERYSAGWHMENGVKLLVSQGLSGTFLPLRLGTSAEVHVITLRRQTNE